MQIDDVEGTGTPSDPWQLTTPPGKSKFEAYRDSEEGSRVASLNECLDARLLVIRGSLVAADDEEAADAD